MRHDAVRELKASLWLISEADEVAKLPDLKEEYRQDAYPIRNDMVLCAVAEARALGYPAGIRIDPAEPEWPVAFIELPTGQVSWHLPQHVEPWDGHDAEEKAKRIKAFLGEA